MKFATWLGMIWMVNFALEVPCSAQIFTRITLGGDNGWTEGGNWIDYDSDGDLDLFLPNNRRSPNRNFLYRNEGGDVFTKVDTGIIVTDVVMSESGTWGDYDNDGDLDLFVADGGFDRARFNSLYRNEGGGHFIEITTTPLSSELSFSTSSSWADYDNDGDLDLYCTNLQFASNPNQQTSRDFLYRNNGDGSFTKITSGVIATTLTRSFGISWADYDNDNDVDLFVCNSTNILYRNEGGGLAYRDGLIIRALDSPRYVSVGYTPQRYRLVLQHDIAHVTEFLLIAEMRFQQANDVWLREGFANYAARNHAVRTVAELESWQASMKDEVGGGNPIGIHVWSNFPQTVLSSNTTINYYRFFELGTRYLLDPNGNGTTIDDLKTLYNDLGEGIQFRRAFQNTFGISVADYEANYWV